VSGVPDERWGEKPMALIVLKTSYAGRMIEARSRSGRPSQVHIVGMIDKDGSGKLDKKVWRHKYAH
jgi:fatty-acyl-CoA synthase